MKEMFNLPPYATLEEIINTPLKLPLQPAKPLAISKIKSISNKLPYIPAEYRGYFPGTEFVVAEDDQPEAALMGTQPPQKKRKPGRPQRPVQENNSQSIIRFILSDPAAFPADQDDQPGTSGGHPQCPYAQLREDPGVGTDT